MDPIVLINQELKAEVKSHPWLPILLILIIFLLLAGGFYFYKFFMSPLSVPSNNRGYQLHQTIAQTLARSDKYNLLIREADKAILEKDQKVKYQLLKQLFINFKQAYTSTKDVKILAGLYQLKNYAQSSKFFDEDDFVINLK